MMPSHQSAVAQARARAPKAQPRVAVVLGSGWSGLTEHVRDATHIPYAALQGFPSAAVSGHAGELVLGRIGGREVAVLSGRKHAYEEGDVKAMRVPLLALQALGCEIVVQTNAAGSLDPRMAPGSLMLVRDHINLPQLSPLVGEVGAERFVDMVDAYDPQLCESALAVARRGGVELHQGVYLWCLGPQFETPAEIRMFRQMGADAVGMSTVPETILARRAGMKVMAFSLITNLAAGLSAQKLSHAQTLEQAGRVKEKAGKLLADVIEEIAP
ncbi:MAG TPA: purine-nucleoside phosphorylase [Usitatibacter sp.]|nr:purine-nucleoside phosphorylase [Usitatibacter sp.]